MDGELMQAFMGRSSFDFSYRPTFDGVRNLFNKQAFYPLLDPTMMMVMRFYFCVDPAKLLSYYESFSKSYEKLGMENLQNYSGQLHFIVKIQICQGRFI